MSDEHGDPQAFVLKSDVAAKLDSYMGKAYDPYIQALGLCEESVRGCQGDLEIFTWL